MVTDIQGSFSSSLCTECMIILMAMVQSYSPTRSTVVRLPAIVYLMSGMVNPIPTFRPPHTLRLHLCLDPLHLPISCYEHLVVVLSPPTIPRQSIEKVSQKDTVSPHFFIL